MAWLEEDPKYGSSRSHSASAAGGTSGGSTRATGRRPTGSRRASRRTSGSSSGAARAPARRGRAEFLLSDGKLAAPPRPRRSSPSDDLVARLPRAHGEAHEDTTLDTFETHVEAPRRHLRGRVRRPGAPGRRPPAAHRPPGQGEGPPRAEAQPGHDQEGAGHASPASGLGGPRGSLGAVPEQGARLPQDGREAAVPDPGGDRAADRPRRAEARRGGRALGRPVPHPARDRGAARARRGGGPAPVHLPDVRLRRPHRGPAERAAPLRGSTTSTSARTVVVREKKRVKGRTTYRRVPMSPLFDRVMRDWLEEHPGGPFTIRQGPRCPRSRSNRRATARSPATRRTTISSGPSRGAGGR